MYYKILEIIREASIEKLHRNPVVDGVEFYRFNPGGIAVIDLLDSEVTFFKCGTILIIANLTSVDLNEKFEKIFDKYFAPITGHVLIPAANIIASAAKIALAKPELVGRITEKS